MDKPIKIRLHVLSPIHIGCDDVYELTTFIIDKNKKKLIEFDPVDFIKNLNPNELDEFNKTISSDNLLAIFKAVKRLYKPVIKGREIDVTDYLMDHYYSRILSLGTFDKKAVINQFTINKTAYNPYTNQPYIPGSSMKGALRTAYLNAIAKVKEITNFRGKSEELESLLLECQAGKLKMSTDPFRMVKVSDFMPVDNLKTKIVYAVNRKKQKSERATLAEKGGVYQIYEIIQPKAIFEGVINVNEPINSSIIKSPIQASKLLTLLNKFYIPLIQNEIKTLKDIDISVPLINEINKHFKEKINKTAFLISIGRHSGAETVTIEGNRKIKIMQGKDKEGRMRYEYKSYSTTIWLASETPKPTNNNGLLPFGWAMIEVV